MNILITGGASGLGEAITRKLVQSSSNFVNFTYCNSLKNAENIEQSLKDTRSFHCDFKKTESVDKFVELIDSMDLDVLINNAISGITKKHFHKIEAEDFEKSFQYNVLPIIKITQKAIKGFKLKKFGKIINILSSYILNTPPIGLSEYVANKAYILSLCKSWAKEYSKFNISSNSISPSFMLTALNNDADERTIEELKQKSPTGELLSVHEVADAVNFLANASQHINGINLVLNSGEYVI